MTEIVAGIVRDCLQWKAAIALLASSSSSVEMKEGVRIAGEDRFPRPQTRAYLWR